MRMSGRERVETSKAWTHGVWRTKVWARRGIGSANLDVEVRCSGIAGQNQDVVRMGLPKIRCRQDAKEQGPTSAGRRSTGADAIRIEKRRVRSRLDGRAQGQTSPGCKSARAHVGWTEERGGRRRVEGTAERRRRQDAQDVGVGVGTAPGRRARDNKNQDATSLGRRVQVSG